MSRYIYDPSTTEELSRLQALERANDPLTISCFDRLGVGDGWRCLEIGSGAGSITRWLCERVGQTGWVVATDLDTRFVDEIAAPNLEVRRHDITSDALEREAFDLVHSRFVLEHLPEHEVALTKMVDALAPGGWLVAEDVDLLSAIASDPEQRFNIPESGRDLAARVTGIFVTFAERRGIDVDYGRRLPLRLHEHGLTDIGAEGRLRLMWSGSPEAEVGRLTMGRLSALAVEAGLITDRERDEFLETVSAPGAAYYSPVTMSVWGRKPS